MPLSIFDLDNTLLAGDSDYEWGEFLIKEGVVDREAHAAANDRFLRDYEAGRLDIDEFLTFQLQPLAGRSVAEMAILHRRYMEDRIEPLILPAAIELVEKCRAAGDELLIITATNRFITGPIAERFGIGQLLATEAEIVDGYYTGRSTDTPCFQEGKVKRLHAWLSGQGRDYDLAASAFYSDSHNDLPLLELVGHPCAVDPDPVLARVAKERSWPTISLRDQAQP
jgi:HAD superfamily hydrolase (TIGR01490 family)